MQIDVPSYEEQTRIADLLISINNKIMLEKQLLLKHQHQKKHLLQNLFI